MNEQDIRSIVSVLTGKLQKEGFEWVLEEYYETVQAGKVVTKLAKYEHWNEDDSEFKVSGRPKTVTGTVPLSLKEQALLLLSAIENAIIVPHNVIVSIYSGLKKHFDGNRLRDIVFEPDLESVEKTPGFEDSLPSKMRALRVDFEVETENNGSIKKLETLCVQLKEAITK